LLGEFVVEGLVHFVEVEVEEVEAGNHDVPLKRELLRIGITRDIRLRNEARG
jgi:hypothetical protein